MEEFLENRIRLPQQERRLVSIVSWLFILSFICNMALVGAIMYMLPLKEKVPYLLTYGKTENILFEVNKISDTLKSNKVFIEQQLESYVLKRETHNRAEEFLKTKYEYLLAYSNEAVYKEYVNFFNKNRDIFQNDNFKRSVRVLNTSLLGSSIAMIDFEVADTINGEISKKYFKATIEYKFYPQKVSYEVAKINPIGLTISTYQISASKREDKK